MAPRSPTTLPLVQPIVPVLRGAPFDDPAWVFEPKYNVDATSLTAVSSYSSRSRRPLRHPSSRALSVQAEI